jgi:hypothetical protein
VTLNLTFPEEMEAPLRWAVGVVFEEFLGLEVSIATMDTNEFTISHSSKRLTMPALFPRWGIDGPKVTDAIPTPPLSSWDLGALHSQIDHADFPRSLPLLFGTSDVFVSDDAIRVGVDILGTIFFMLSRFEEVFATHRDVHDRFPASASLANLSGFLYRPIVDEYVEVLWALMKKLWPGLMRKAQAGRVFVSCDVDQPFDRVGNSYSKLARSVGGDLCRRLDPGLAVNRVRNFSQSTRDDYRFDPYHTFDWYMDVCEKNNRQAAFYFIAGHTAGEIDGTYEIFETRILALLSQISRRGHEIGLHASYNTFRAPESISNERLRLVAACEKAGLNIAIEGNRQHYLRWDASQTADHLDKAGFRYDTSGSFADAPGFRYGTSRTFTMWSWQTMSSLSIKQRPLVLMECSVLSKSNLNLGYTDKSLSFMKQLRYQALRFGGDFTVLWHNSHLLSNSDREFFCEIVGNG